MTRQFVEVFITNVEDPVMSMVIQSCLASMIEGSKVSFDLEDSDRVLRIASPIEINADAVVKVLATFGIDSEVMPDAELNDLQPAAGRSTDSQTSPHSRKSQIKNQ